MGEAESSFNVDDPDQDEDSSDEICEPENSVKIEDPTKFMSRQELVNNLLVLATKLRHKGLTYVSSEDIVRLVNISSSVSSATCSTKYHWKNMLNFFGSEVKKIYVCMFCNGYVGEIPKTKELFFLCPLCNKSNRKEENLRKGFMFLQCSLVGQLRHILENEVNDSDFTTHVPQAGVISDVFDGKFYKEHMKSDMISINLNCDGVPIFNTSGYELYPVLATLNELKPKKRKKFIMLCALWCGKGVPLDFDLFFKPFVSEAQKLYKYGFTFKRDGITIHKKVLVVAVVGDSPVRAKLQNCISLTGYHGCMYCLNPGIEVAKGKGTTHVYLFEEYEMRSHQQTIEHAETQSFGIKGLPPLLGVPHHDVIRCVAVDSMHTVLLCVVRTFVKLWFKPRKYEKDEPRLKYDFSKKINDVDRLLKLIKPSLEVSRCPRPMSERQYWRAHEWAAWLFFYSIPIMSVLFPANYVRHWSLLVSAASILYGTSIRRSDVYKAQNMLNLFVQGICDHSLYGVEYAIPSVHLLLHLPATVFDLGPLWSHSAFIYEDFNAVLQDSVKSSNGVMTQVTDYFRLKQTVSKLSKIVWDEMSQFQREYFNKMMHGGMFSESLVQVDKVKLLGGGKRGALSNNQFLALKRLSSKYHRECPAVYYERAVVNGELIHSSSYSRVEKRQSYFVLVQNANVVFEIENFILFPDNRCYAVGFARTIQRDMMAQDIKLPSLKVLKPKEVNMSAVRLKHIIEKVSVLQGICRFEIACVHPNHVEFGRSS